MEVYTQKSREVKAHKANIFRRLFRAIQPREAAEARIDEPAEVLELVESIKSARKEWIDASTSFEYVSDKEIVDYYTYKIKACQVRYEYLLKKAKNLGVKAETLETLRLLFG